MQHVVPSQSLPAAFLPPGTRLGRYELIRRLAVGGMAELYLARATGIAGFEKLVALKRILPQFAENEAFVAMFLDEARLAATIHHANVAQVYDIGRCDDGLYFTMEYVHGEDVRTLLTAASRCGGLPIEHAVGIGIGVAAGLHAAHELTAPDGAPLHLVHRDVSPSNVLVSFGGDVKLIDFGVAKAAFRHTETASGTVKGKVAYMAPEQCVGGAVDRRSDVFALGILLWEMTTCRRLFAAGSDYAALRKIVDEDAPAPSTVCAGYPAELEAIVMRALARRPERRFATAQELQLALEAFARRTGSPVSPVSLGQHVRTLCPERVRPAGTAVDAPVPAHGPRSRPLRRTAPRLRPATDLEVSLQLSACPVEVAAEMAAEPAIGLPPRAIGSGQIDTAMFQIISALDVAVAAPAPVAPAPVALPQAAASRVSPAIPPRRARAALRIAAAVVVGALVAVIAGDALRAGRPLSVVAPVPVVLSPSPAPRAASVAAPAPAAAPAPVSAAATGAVSPRTEERRPETRRPARTRKPPRRTPPRKAVPIDPDATLSTF